MENLIPVLALAACIFLLIFLNEFGKCLAGWLGGIPARDMRIRMFVFPQRVDLRVEDHWISVLVDPDAYLAALRRYVVTETRFYLFIAGGHLLEVPLTAASILLLVQLGWPEFAFVLALLTLIFTTIYILQDVPRTLISGVSCGTISALWYTAKLPTALLVLAIVAARVFLVWYAAEHRLTNG